MTSLERPFLQVLTVGFVALFDLSAADVESAGGFVSGSGESQVGLIQSQGAFGLGFGSVEIRSTDASITGQSGPLSSVQNYPKVTDERFNLIASLGDSLEISYDDIAFLSGVVEVDGEDLSYRVEVNGGQLTQDGTPTSAVFLRSGQRFNWQLPDTGNLEGLALTVVGVDAVALSSGDSPLSIEETGGITLTITASDGTELGGTASAELGNAEFPEGVVTEAYEITNTSIQTNNGSPLQRLNAEAATWSAEERATGLVLLREPPPRSALLTVNSIDVTGDASGDFIVGDIDLPLVLPPGASESFTVTFRPLDHGDRLASVALARPGNPQGFFEFGVTGFGNRAPSGGGDEIVRSIGLDPIKIRVADLLLNDQDLDGDGVQFGGLVAPLSARGRPVEMLNNQWLVYYPGSPDEPQDDQVEYVISDDRGSSATAVVTILEVASNAQSGAFEATLVAGPGGPVTILARGVPGRRYQAQFTDQLNPPNTVWTDLGVPISASAANGSFRIEDPQAPAVQRIYRIIEAALQP